MKDKTVIRSITRDTLFNGQVVCSQYAQGYRFSIDSILLSHFIQPRKSEQIAELGSGCGVIGLILLYRYPDHNIHITGYELQPDLASICRQKVAANGFDTLFEVVEGSVQEIARSAEPESFSQVVSNPPYYFKNSGRLTANKEALAARHQKETQLTDFITAAAYAVKNKGRVAIIYPADLAAELLATLQQSKLEPKRVQFVYPYPDGGADAKLILVEGFKNGGIGMRVTPPLYIHQYKGGPYSEEVAAMFAPS